MQEINPLLNSSQISLQNVNNNNNQIQNSQSNMNQQQQQLTPPHFDFLEQMLSNLWDPNTETTPSASDNVVFPYDQQQLLLSLPGNDVLHPTSFNFPNSGGGGGSSTSVQPLFNGFTGQASNQAQHFQHPQDQNFGGATNQAPVVNGKPVQLKPRVRARRGQATDPHSIAERLRRERIAERMKALQELVPNANKTDKASMLDEIIDYVKFLQLQVKVLSMSRLGGAAAVAPLVANLSSQGGDDGIQTNGNSNGDGVLTQNSNGNQTTPSTSNDSLTMTEHQVAKLMEQDMGSAMQYLQGKGLCLMPISLATAISTTTCHTRNPLIPTVSSYGEGPSSPSLSVLTVQSAVSAVKDAASVSKL